MDATTTGNEPDTPEFDDSFDGLLSVKCGKIRVKPRRDEIKECLICSARVIKMRDHLANKHKMEKDSPLKQFISSFFRTLHTRKFFHCDQCNIRLADQYKHHQEHTDNKIENRDDISKFPVPMRKKLEPLRHFDPLPNEHCVKQYAEYERRTAIDSKSQYTRNVPGNVRRFLGLGMDATSQFQDPAKLAEFVRQFFNDSKLPRR